jgi:hypothetical protein
MGTTAERRSAAMNPFRNLECLLVTGHLCDILSELPKKLAFPRTQLLDAAAWLKDEISSSSCSERWSQFCPYVHATIALERLQKVAD